MKRKLIDLSNQRAQLLQSAETALAANNTADYDSAMEKVSNLNDEIGRVQNLLQEQERTVLSHTPDVSEARDMAEERGNTLMNGGSIGFTVDEVRRALSNAGTTLATGTLVAPVGAGTDIHDPLGNMPSSIVDQVYVQDCTGITGWEEPYVITELDAKAGKPATTAGTKRGASTDPTFGVAQISPYELTVTSYVDRNISRLSPANYYAKIYNMAMRAMRRKLASLIALGDNASAPTIMYGLLNAKNKAKADIYATQKVETVDENLLDSLFFAYGSDAAIGQNARLYLTKKDLAAIGKVRNTDKQRVFKIRPDGSNPNSGVIEDGGTIIPYTILPDLTSLTDANKGSADIKTMVYGDPMNYMLGLFGDYSIRVDESVKAEERLLTILGDAMVGGNLVVDKGMVVATVPHT